MKLYRFSCGCAWPVLRESTDPDILPLLDFDITKAQRELNWQPRYSTDQMFAESYDWYLANREKILQAHGASHHRSAVKQGILSLVKRVL